MKLFCLFLLLLFLLYATYLFVTINTCSTLSPFAFLISEINNYLEWPLPFSFAIPVHSNTLDRNCPSIWRNITFGYDEEDVLRCISSECLDVYFNVTADNSSRWCATRFASGTHCPMSLFQLEEKAYEIDPRFRGNSGDSLAMKLLTNISQDGLLLMTSSKYITPFHSAATVTHHLLLRGKKVWCFAPASITE